MMYQRLVRIEQKILDRLGEPFPLEGLNLSVKTSIGIALYPLDGTVPEALLQRADRAMYQAKGLGGQCCRFASEDINRQFAKKPVGKSESNLE